MLYAMSEVFHHDLGILDYLSEDWRCPRTCTSRIGSRASHWRNSPCYRETAPIADIVFASRWTPWSCWQFQASRTSIEVESRGQDVDTGGSRGCSYLIGEVGALCGPGPGLPWEGILLVLANEGAAIHRTV